jgi:hypothetical protein
MKSPDDSGRDSEPQAPAKLVAVLRRSRSEPTFVPPAVDESVLRAAHQHLAPKTQARFRWLPLLSWLATATAILVAAVLILARFKPGVVPNPTAFAKEDINHDGRVDILDAFAIARQLKQGTVSNPHLDINGDGVVDERDMQMIVTEAVKLKNGGRS